MIRYSLIIVPILGFLLSFYAWYVGRQFNKNRQYKAVCDIRENFSCTQAFASPYGHIAGISNAAGGIFFYALIIGLAFYNQVTYILYVSLLSLLGTLYLAYLQYFNIQNFCLVCTAIYVVNIMLAVFSYWGF